MLSIFKYFIENSFVLKKWGIGKVDILIYSDTVRILPINKCDF